MAYRGLLNRIFPSPVSNPNVVVVNAIGYARISARASINSTVNVFPTAYARIRSTALVSAQKIIYVQAGSITYARVFTYRGLTNTTTAGIRVISNANAVAQINKTALVQGPDSCFIFPYNRWSDTSSGTVTASSEIAAFPASNTQKSQRSKVWRSNADTAAYLVRDLGSAYRINSVAIVSHNATNTGTFRVRVANVADFSTTLYDSGYVNTWESSFATSGITSEFAESDGRPTNATIELFRYCSENARTVRWMVFAEVAARYVRIDFLDSDNALGWNELAYVYAGLCININPSQLYGWTLQLNAINRINISASGQKWIDDLYKQISVTGTFAGRPSEQTMAFWYWIYQKLGMTGEFIIAFQPENLPKKFWYTLYGHLKNMPDLTNVGFNTYETALEIEELL